MTPSRIVLSLLASSAVAALGCSDGEAPPPEQVYGGTAIDHGEALFHDPSIAKTSFNAYACSTCHEATRGEAGAAILTGAPLAGAAKRPSYWGGQEMELLRSINDCLYYFMLKDKVWTAEEEDAKAMYAYLESLPSDAQAEAPAPFTILYKVEDAPHGDAGRGAPLYASACQSCHGPPHTGEGRLVGRAPILPDQTLSEHPSPTYSDKDRRLVFVEKVRHGGFVGYGGQMPPFSEESLSDQELGDILAFLGVP